MEKENGTTKTKIGRFKDRHVFVREFTYNREDDDIIINDLLEFTAKQIQRGKEFMSTMLTWKTTENQRLLANRIEYGQMVGYHSHDFYELCYVYNDKVYQYINNDIIVMQKGDLLIMHPDICHSLYPNPCANAVNILIDRKYAHEISEKLFYLYSENPFSFVVNKKSYTLLHTENEEMAGLIKSMELFPYETLKKNNIMNLYLESTFYQIAALLLSDEKNGNAFTVVNGYSSKSKKNIDEILDYINSNYAHIDADSVCSRFHYSRMQLYRLLKKATGLSFVDYISDLRFRHAKNLLVSTNMSVKKISEHIGLEQNYFYKFFQGYTGMTPREYRLKKMNTKE